MSYLYQWLKWELLFLLKHGVKHVQSSLNFPLGIQSKINLFVVAWNFSLHEESDWE